MASFIVKQMVGDQLSSVKGAVGGDKDKDEKSGDGEDEEMSAELAEERRKEEEKRKEKYRKMEEEREKMRQGIRDKYNIKKKEEIQWEPAPGAIGRSARKPGESAPLPGMEGKGDESMIPKDLDDFKNKMTSLPGLAGEKFGAVQEKCCIQ